MWGDNQTKRRWFKTLKFVSKFKSGVTVLDIGGLNIFGQRLAEACELKYNYTSGDLNYFGWSNSDTKFDNIFCFEIIEHLMNPLLFLQELKKCCNRDTKIFITYPFTPRWLMSNRHFHEYRDIEFITLCHEAGFRIVNYNTYHNRHDVSFYLTGIRPFLRFFVMLFKLSKLNLYMIERES